ncbi:serine protein kinase RIO [Candidatus Parvarchaeota archaeon]|nr:serine protein kinase RIO [Candidatus Parvarchaeota archaeon]
MTKSKVFSHVFDEETLRNVNKLQGDGYISNLLGPIGTGKESYVFYSRDFHDKLVAVKIHRHNIDAFKSIPAYIRLRGRKSGGFLKQINDWTRFEYNFLSKAHNLGINTPEPIRCYENIIVMQFIGSDDNPSKLAVKDRDFDAEKWYGLIIKFIVDMAKNGMIHGDLSPYNILNYNGEPFIIDFSQALKLSSSTINFLIRDITNINNWFLSLKYKSTKEAKEIIEEIGWKDEN